jgi:hypothetical protein
VAPVAQVAAVERHGISGAAAIQLAPVHQLVVSVVQEQIRRAGRLEGSRHRLGWIGAVGEAPTLALGLGRHASRAVLGVGVHAVAADRQQRQPVGDIALQPAQLRLDVLHKRAVGADEQHQHRPLPQGLPLQRPPVHRLQGRLQQGKGQGRAQGQHRGRGEAHGGGGSPRIMAAALQRWGSRAGPAGVVIR